MLRQHKKYILMTALITAAPLLVGLLLWSRLPAELATHFDFEGQPNGWSGRAFTVLGLPLLLTGLHLLCALGTASDPKHRNIHGRIFRLVLWICPAVSWFALGSIYLYALGLPVDIALLAQVLLGVMFIVLGNYLPKCRQNHTVGIKLPWTLDDEENWNHTHRFAGWLWMADGILFLAAALLGALRPWMLGGLILLAVLAPAVYSYLYYKRHGEEK